MTTTIGAPAFRSRGFLMLPGIIPATVITALRAEAAIILDRLVACMSVTREPDPRVTWWRLPDGRPYVLKVKPVLDLSPTAATVATDPALLTVIAQLLGGPPQLMEDKISYKQTVTVAGAWPQLPVLGEEVHKHSDAAYFHARGFDDPIMSVAICLDDAPAEAGALRVWPGSHLRNIQHLPTRDHGPVVQDAAAPDAESVLLSASAGSALVWDSRLVHASGPNRSGRPRRLLVLGYARTLPEGR